MRGVAHSLLDKSFLGYRGLNLPIPICWNLFGEEKIVNTSLTKSKKYISHIYASHCLGLIFTPNYLKILIHPLPHTHTNTTGARVGPCVEIIFSQYTHLVQGKSSVFEHCFILAISTYYYQTPLPPIHTPRAGQVIV